MQIRIKLVDGRITSGGGNRQYVVFRLTGDGGFSVRSTNGAKDAVTWARTKWRTSGFHYLVINTHSGEAIALYPYIERNLPVGHPPIKSGCETCRGGWHIDPDQVVSESDGQAWIIDHDIGCPDFKGPEPE